MRKFLSTLGIQAQFTAAMLLVGATAGLSLVSTLIVSSETKNTFTELGEERLPAIFEAVEAVGRLNDVVKTFTRVRDAATSEEHQESIRLADAAVEGALTSLRSIAVSPDIDAAQRASLEAALPQVSSVKSRLSQAVESRLQSLANLEQLWTEAQTLHKNATGAVETIVDDAAFDITLTADEAQEQVAANLETLLSDDVQKLIAALSFKNAIAEAAGHLSSVVNADDVGAAAAASDRLESALQEVDTYLQGLSEGARNQLEGPAALFVENARDAMTRRSRTVTADVSTAVAAVGQAKRELDSGLASYVDDASFSLSIAGSDLSETAAEAMSNLAEATTGHFRNMIDVEATLNSAVGALGRMVTATDETALALIVQETAIISTTLKDILQSNRIDDAELVAKLERLQALMQEEGGLPSARAAVFAGAAEADAAKIEADALLQTLAAAARAYVDSQRQLGAASMETAGTVVETGRLTQIGVAGICIFAVFAVTVFFVRPRIVRPLRQFKDAVAQLAQGEQVTLPGEDRHDEIGQLARSMTMIYERGVEAARIRLALDNSSAMMLIAGPDNRILYLNDRLRTFLSTAASSIARDLPGFDVNTLIGAPLDAAHNVDGGGFSTRVAGLDSVETMEMTLGGRRIALAAGPVKNAAGERLGSVVEWRDMTVELAVQSQIDGVVAAANAGDFTGRVDLSGAEGALRQMSENVNRLVATVEAGVTETSRVVSSISKGDLSNEMTGNFDGSFQRLQQDVNATVHRLRDLVGQIQSRTHNMTRRVSEVLTGSQDLSQRAEAQAASLEETAATMEEISSTIKTNAANADNASKTSQDSSQSADKGAEVVGQAVGAMDRIEKSSSEIGEIIGVIDAIAFQTNLLALNAAVEAARAGDAGKGFAVVASEVRTLAQRSSDAARDIRQLIVDSSGHVESGVRLVRETGDALTTINGAIRSVEEMVRSIASANQEQSAGVQEISSTVSHLDSMTQSNAALAERSAANAKALAEDADQLVELVSFFRSEGARGAASPEAAADGAWREAANS